MKKARVTADILYKEQFYTTFRGEVDMMLDMVSGEWAISDDDIEKAVRARYSAVGNNPNYHIFVTKIVKS